MNFPIGTIDRFLDRIRFKPDTECWIWIGGQNSGYGAFECNLDESSKRTWRTHRLAFGLANGLPDRGHHIHHVCQNKICCNPSHLEALTLDDHCREEKRLQGLRNCCQKGHPYTPETTIHSTNGRRQCRICASTSRRRLYQLTHAKGKREITQCKYGHEFTAENTYHYTTPVGGPGRGCRICRNRQRQLGTILARKKFAESLHLVKPKNTHCFNGHCYEEVGWKVEPTGTVKCRQCCRDQVNARNAEKRLTAIPKTHCVKGHDLTGENGYRAGARLICRICFGHKKIRPRPSDPSFAPNYQGE